MNRDPAHVTFVVDPLLDYPALGFVANHAYWLSGLTLRDTAHLLRVIRAEINGLGHVGIGLAPLFAALVDFPGRQLKAPPPHDLRSLIQELAARGKVVLFSSHELETVERVCSHVVILHRGKVVADDSIEHLRTLMAAPTLEAIFSQLAVEQDTAAISREIANLIQA